MSNRPFGAEPVPIVEPTLRRGMACLSCRRRKSKCGGERPCCRQCVRLGRADSCEYSNSRRAHSESSAQALEVDEYQLQSPVESSFPDEAHGSSRSVLLHDPHATYHGPQVLPTIYQDYGADFSLSPVVPMFSEMQGINYSNWWDMDNPPPNISESLITHFMPHRHRLGFALNVERFMTSMRLPPGHPDRPHAALVNAVYLWGLLLSPTNTPTRLSDNRDARENALKVLNRALLALSEWSGDVLQKRMHAVQAEILIAQYLFYECRHLEGLVHVSASVTMAIGCSLHKIRYPQGHPSQTADGRVHRQWNPEGPFELPPPRDMHEMKERMDLFRTVLILDKCWSVAVQCSPMTDNIRLDPAWMQSNGLPTEFNFDGPFPSGSNSGATYQDAAPLVQFIHAAKFYTTAERMCSESRSRSGSPQFPGGSIANAPGRGTIPQTSLELVHAIDNFIQSLPGAGQSLPFSASVARLPSPVQANADFILAESLAHGAIIRALVQYIRVNADAFVKVIQSALRVVTLMEIGVRQDLNSLNPIITIVWREAAQVLAQNARTSLVTSQEVNLNVGDGLLRMVAALAISREDIILSQQSSRLSENLHHTFIPPTAPPS